MSKKKQMEGKKEKGTVHHSWNCQTLGRRTWTILRSLCLACPYPCISTSIHFYPEASCLLGAHRAVLFKALPTQQIRILILHSNQTIPSTTFKYILVNPTSICLRSVILISTSLCVIFSKSPVLYLHYIGDPFCVLNILCDHFVSFLEERNVANSLKVFSHLQELRQVKTPLRIFFPAFPSKLSSLRSCLAHGTLFAYCCPSCVFGSLEEHERV